MSSHRGTNKSRWNKQRHHDHNSRQSSTQSPNSYPEWHGISAEYGDQIASNSKAPISPTSQARAHEFTRSYSPSSYYDKYSNEAQRSSTINQAISKNHPPSPTYQDYRSNRSLSPPTYRPSERSQGSHYRFDQSGTRFEAFSSLHNRPPLLEAGSFPPMSYYKTTEPLVQSQFTPLSPTPSYMALASEPVITQLPSPTTKLLILDLNGTLVWRTDRKGPNRKIHPRPYMNAFTSYVLHPESGLYTMIWSSAKPENVQKMAVECFGAEKKELLKAIWARDTLGLSERDYNNKVQTVKDLRTIWKGIEFDSSSGTRFSAKDTLLLDDSALKAHRQPYNHIILPEYDKTLFRKDRELFYQLEDQTKGISSNTSLKDETTYDQTLLAVIGILAEIVNHENAAAWIRAGGMWAGKRPTKASSSTTLPLGTGTGERMAVIPGSMTNTPLRIDPRDLRRSKTQVEPPWNDAEYGGLNIFAPLCTSVRKKAQPQTAQKGPAEEELWFHDARVIAEWVRRGEEALAKLSIPCSPGFSPAPSR